MSSCMSAAERQKSISCLSTANGVLRNNRSDNGIKKAGGMSYLLPTLTVSCCLGFCLNVSLTLPAPAGAAPFDKLFLLKQPV